MTLLLLTLMTLVEPITPNALNDALQFPLGAEKAAAIAAQIKAAYPEGTNLAAGKHKPLVDKSSVAFIIDAGPKAKSVRISGMINHSKGLDLVPIGETGLWARVESIPTDTKFAMHYEVEGKRVGGVAVEMPDWKYPPESSEQPGRKYGRYEPIVFRSEVFKNNRTGWIYVPAEHDPAKPSALMVFQDGDAYKKEFVGTVVDNLIAEKAMPVTILLLLNPGVNDDKSPNRSFEYDTLSDQYVTFLEKEAIPLVSKTYKLRDRANDRAIGGASSGGICSFTAAWQRPDLFGRVCSHIGSYTNIRGGDVYPKLVRETPKKPIKVFMHDGTNDLINQHGDWWRANEAMFAALSEKQYDVEFLRDRSFHAYWSCGRVLPESLRKTWAGYTP